MHKNTRNILGNPSTQGKKTQQSFAIFSREDPPSTTKPITQKGAAMTEKASS